APAHKSFADRNSLYQQITDKIIAELEQGRVPWVQPWGNVTAPLGLPKNAATSRAYSGVNILILWIACMERGFSTQHWLTFRQAPISVLAATAPSMSPAPTTSRCRRPRAISSPSIGTGPSVMNWATGPELGTG